MINMDDKRHSMLSRVLVRIALPGAALIALCIWQRKVVSNTLLIAFGAAVVAFLAEPLARLYEKRLRRNVAAVFALITLIGGLLGGFVLLLPSLVREITELGRSLPESIAVLKNVFLSVSGWFERHIPGLKIPAPELSGATLPKLAAGTLNLAGSVADVFYRLSLMVVLGCFFLCDRSSLMIRMELLIPQPLRCTAVRMGNAVCRELKLYVRGQLMIAGAVGTISAIGLALVGVPSALVLGILVGVLNMVPYFGPVLGAIPAVLMALGEGWVTALLAAGVMFAVQQLDGMFISPRIMGTLTGVSPAAVLVVVFAGSMVAGVAGMLFALPLLMAIRTVFRVFVQRHENV